ncbi:MAG: HindIII family type II restriction endonuclease [Defluviitaleaceae bacterium]|nr:HindIII family type II restriction endonuclease [Defluviitaleaceae bacterium]
MFQKLVSLVIDYANDDFSVASEKLDNFVSNADDFEDIVLQIGAIPESIAHDSTEEKLFSKVSDAVLSRAFRELGLKSKVLTERANSADVIAKSMFHNYTLVADAKAFRLSRTAKNQKDFKVKSLSDWRKDENYAVLCSPYFQYPQRQSQIYAQSVDNNVCLFSWEHILFLLKHKIKENECIDLSVLWNFGEFKAKTTLVYKKNVSFIREFDAACVLLAGASQSDFGKLLDNCIVKFKDRATTEKAYWETERKTIETYSRKQAIDELIKNKKIVEKMQQIDLYIKRISR